MKVLISASLRGVLGGEVGSEGSVGTVCVCVYVCVCVCVCVRVRVHEMYG